MFGGFLLVVMVLLVWFWCWLRLDAKSSLIARNVIKWKDSGFYSFSLGMSLCDEVLENEDGFFLFFFVS